MASKKLGLALALILPETIVLMLMYFTGFADFIISKHFILLGTLLAVLPLSLIPASLIKVVFSEIRLREKIEVLVYLSGVFLGLFSIVYFIESSLYIVNIESIFIIGFGMILIPIMLIYSTYSSERFKKEMDDLELKQFIATYGFEPELNGGTIDEFIKSNFKYNYIEILH